MDKQLNLPEVYKSANEALLCDVYEDLQRFGGFMASVNRYIKTLPAPRLISLFRGTKIRQEQHVGPEQLEASEASAGIFRQPIYAGASEKESIAAEFGKQEGSPIIQYIVPAGCRRCTVLPAQLSAYPEEAEWLIMPYTGMRYKGSEPREFPAGSGQSRLVVTFELVDESEVPPNAPSHLMVCETSGRVTEVHAEERVEGHGEQVDKVDSGTLLPVGDDDDDTEEQVHSFQWDNDGVWADYEPPI
jgi:hypothetical protein